MLLLDRDRLQTTLDVGVDRHQSRAYDAGQQSRGGAQIGRDDGMNVARGLFAKSYTERACERR